MAISTLEPISLPKDEKEQVSELHKLLQKEGRALLIGKGGKPARELPDAVYGLLLEILSLMEQEKAISIVPYNQDLTTQQAADILRVSRPHLVKLVESRQIEFHRVGTHRRIYLRDLMKYKQLRDEARHAAVVRMANDAEESGLYDEVLLPDE